MHFKKIKDSHYLSTIESSKQFLNECRKQLSKKLGKPKVKKKKPY